MLVRLPDVCESLSADAGRPAPGDYGTQTSGEPRPAARNVTVFDDTNRTSGLAAEVLATAAEEFPLQAPPRRVTRADAPIPFAVDLELALLPSREQLADAVRGVLAFAPEVAS